MCHPLKVEHEIAGRAEGDVDLLARLVHASPAVLYSCKVTGDCGTIAVTDNVRRLLGYAPEDFVSDPSFWAVRIHPQDSARVFEKEMPKLLREGEQTIEYRFQQADGSYVWLRDQMRLERDEDGKPSRILGCWLPISGHRETVFVVQVGQAPETTTITTAGGKYAKQT